MDSPDGGFGQTLQALAMIKVMCGIAIVVLYNYVYRTIDNNHNGTTSTTTTVDENVTTATTTITTPETQTSIPPTTTPKKPKVSLLDSVQELAKSPELQNMAIMVFGYNVCASRCWPWRDRFFCWWRCQIKTHYFERRENCNIFIFFNKQIISNHL